MNIVQQNASGIAAIQKDLALSLETAAGAGAALESLKAHLSATARTMLAEGGASAMVAGALARHLDAPTGANTRAWLGEVDARVRELRSAGRAEIAPVLDALAQVVADGVNARAAVDELRSSFDAAVTDARSAGRASDTACAKNSLPTPGPLSVANGESYSGPLPVTPAASERTVTITSDNPDVVRVRSPFVVVAKGPAQVLFTVDVDMGSADLRYAQPRHLDPRYRKAARGRTETAENCVGAGVARAVAAGS